MAEVILGLIILGMMVERYFFSRDMAEQLEKCMKAVMSRNINDYLSATNQPKKDSEFVQEDVDLNDATDEEFLTAIKKSQET